MLRSSRRRRPFSRSSPRRGFRFARSFRARSIHRRDSKIRPGLTKCATFSSSRAESPDGRAARTACSCSARSSSGASWPRPSRKVSLIHESSGFLACWCSCRPSCINNSGPTSDSGTRDVVSRDSSISSGLPKTACSRSRKHRSPLRPSRSCGGTSPNIFHGSRRLRWRSFPESDALTSRPQTLGTGAGFLGWWSLPMTSRQTTRLRPRPGAPGRLRSVASEARASAKRGSAPKPFEMALDELPVRSGACGGRRTRLPTRSPRPGSRPGSCPPGSTPGRGWPRSGPSRCRRRRPGRGPWTRGC